MPLFVDFYLLADDEQSLCRLMDWAFGLEMLVEPLNENESWLGDINDKNTNSNQSLIKYHVCNPRNDELIGIIYFDLFERDNKFRGENATFPIICQRNNLIFNETETEIEKQIPTVAISLNFRQDTNGIHNHEREFLSHNEMISLYHEFGHCLQYILSNTQYQTLSGPRGLPLDFVEFTSIFMENFMFDENFLRYAIMDNRNNEQESENSNENDNSNEIDKQLLNLIQNSNCKHLSQMQKILDCLIDLRIHGSQEWQNKSIFDIFYQTYLPFVELLRDNNECRRDINDSMNAYYMRLSCSPHFIDYPANLYSYTINQDLSKNIWNNSFGNYNYEYDKNNARQSFNQWKDHIRLYGNKLQNSLFAMGSTGVPQQCLASFNN